MLNGFEKWLDKMIPQTIPEDVVAFCFNLYEDAGNNWSMELVGCSSFDENDADWCCDEVTDFGTRNHCFSWNEETNWENVLEESKAVLDSYLKDGRNADVLKSKAAVAVGFVDGDIELVYQK